VKQRIHPLVAIVVVAGALAGVWYCYASVFTGRTVGQVGTPASVKMTPPPAGAGPTGPAGTPKSAGSASATRGGSASS